MSTLGQFHNDKNQDNIMNVNSPHDSNFFKEYEIISVDIFRMRIENFLSGGHFCNIFVGKKY